jgi:hypothetical protein
MGYWGDMTDTKLETLVKLVGHGEIAVGMRLGLLVVDDAAILYVPTPQSLELDRIDRSEPNAVQLDAWETERLVGSIVTRNSPNPRQRPAITVDAIEQARQSIRNDRTGTPDLKRLVDYLRKRMSIVKVEGRKYRLTSSRLQLPRELVEAIGSQDREINRRRRRSGNGGGGEGNSGWNCPAQGDVSGPPRDIRLCPERHPESRV